MKYKNDYKPEEKEPITKENDNRDTPPDEWDFNFMYPVTLLRSDRIELRPFVSSLYGKMLFEGTQDPDLIPYDDWDVTQDGLYAITERWRRSSNNIFYAIFTAPLSSPDVPPEKYVMAGWASAHAVNGDALSAALGLMVFPPFQRTHVSTHATGLMLKRVLDMPVPDGDSPLSEEGGWGFRRVEWSSASCNLASVRSAARMGFKREGIKRNAGVMKGKDKIADGTGRPGDMQDGKKSRNIWVSSITCQDWEDGGRELVEKQMARRS